jgi:hypothetical protein
LGHIIEKSIDYIRQKYPEVNINRNDENIEVEGRFIIEAKYKDIILDIAPKLIILIPYDYPNKIPLVFETENKIDSEHKLSNGALCVATEFDLLIQLYNSKNISDYFQKFLIPYFISYYGWLKYNTIVYGERTHGVEGIYQSISEYFCIDNNRSLVNNFLLWTSRKRKFQLIFPKHKWYVLLRKYSEKVGRLRKVNIIKLRKFYKQLLLMDEKEKYYYRYRSRN